MYLICTTQKKIRRTVVFFFLLQKETPFTRITTCKPYRLCQHLNMFLWPSFYNICFHNLLVRRMAIQTDWQVLLIVRSSLLARVRRPKNKHENKLKVNVLSEDPNIPATKIMNKNTKNKFENIHHPNIVPRPTSILLAHIWVIRISWKLQLLPVVLLPTTKPQHWT